MIRALIFDFDGVILDTESALIQAYADVHATHSVPFDGDHFLGAVGHASLAFDPWRNFPQSIDRGRLDTERKANNHRRDLELSVLPGVIDLLDAARDEGLSVGLASNSTQAHCSGHLERIGLLDRFAVLSCRDEGIPPKPEPDLYLRVLRHFGLRGHEAIAIEDSSTGALAAKRANLWCVAVPGATTRHHDLRHADRQVASLADCALADLIRKFSP